MSTFMQTLGPDSQSFPALTIKTLHIVISTIRNKIQWNLIRNSYVFIHENAFENVVCEMAAILSRPQCVNAVHGRYWVLSRLTPNEYANHVCHKGGSLWCLVNAVHMRYISVNNHSVMVTTKAAYMQRIDFTKHFDILKWCFFIIRQRLGSGYFNNGKSFVSY